MVMHVHRRTLARALTRGRDESGSLVLDILIGMAVFALVAIIAVSAVSQYRMRAYIQTAVSDATATAHAVSAAITDHAGDENVDYPTGVLGAAALTELAVTPTGKASQKSVITVLPDLVDPHEFIVCVEYRGAFAEYKSDEGLLASGEAAKEGYDGCDATPPDDGTDPTTDPTPTPTEEPTPIPTLPEDEYVTVSLDYKGDLVNAPTNVQGISNDGHWVLFSTASGAFADGVPGQDRSFLRNTVTGEVVVFDRYADGTPGAGLMYQATMTPSASHVAFAYHGWDLITGERRASPQLYVWERATNTLDRIEDSSGVPLSDFGPVYNRIDLSDDGRYLAFMTQTPEFIGAPSGGGKRIVRHDRQTGQNVLIDHAPDGAVANSTTGHNTGLTLDLSPNGQHATFTSTATNLDPRATAGRIQVYAWHAATDTVELVSINASGAEANYKQHGGDAFISDDGRHVAWTAQGFEMTNYSTDGYSTVLTRDLQSGTNTIVTRNANGTTARSSRIFGMTGDGSTILFWTPSTATNIVSNKPSVVGGTHLYLWDRATGKYRSVDKRTTDPGNPYARMSGNAAFVAFEASESSDFPDARGNSYRDVVLWNGAVSALLWPTL